MIPAHKLHMAIIMLLIVVFTFCLTFGNSSDMEGIINLAKIPHLWRDAISRSYGHVFRLLVSIPYVKSPMAYVYAALVSLVLYYAYKLFFVPLNRVRLNEDIGYLPDPLRSKKDVANMVRQMRMVGDIPPVYPNGWYGLIEAFKVERGKSLSINCLGMTLAVFRDLTNKVHAIDAYCPHMGANLAVGGVVSNDSIQCPFHGWRYRGEDGKCTHIPNVDKIPDIARVKAWNTVEQNGWIHIWYHAEGVEPTWMVPEIEEIQEGYWTYKGRAEHYISAHIQEIPENAADVLHLSQVHSPFIVAGVNLHDMSSKLWSFIQHNWEAQWEVQQEPNKHVGVMHLKHTMKICGRELSLLKLNIVAEQIGPGIVHLRFDSMLGKGVFQMSVLPVEPLLQKTVFNIYCPWTIPTFVAKLMQTAESMMVERDAMIWNNKRYVYKPLFTRSKEDSLIARHRRWYSQFYSENSPRMDFRKDTMDW